MQYLIRALNKLIRDDSLRLNLGQRVEARFTWNAVTNQYIDLVRLLCKCRTLYAVSDEAYFWLNGFYSGTGTVEYQ